MATGQPTQVVVVQQPVATNQPVTQMAAVGGETNAPQTGQTQVVVVQQVVAQPAEEPLANPRYMRITFLIFGIGMGAWHSATGIIFAIYPAALALVCGFLPSMITVILLITDSTTFCANPGAALIKKVCCCECAGPAKFVLGITLIVAAVLRVVLWLTVAQLFLSVLILFIPGIATAVLLALVVIDVGPMILLIVDWWMYYSNDYEGMFGYKYSPHRAVIGSSIIMAIFGWAMFGLLQGIIDFFNTHSAYTVTSGIETWSWIIQGIVSTAALIFISVITGTGALKGNKVTNSTLRIACLVIGGAVVLIGLLNGVQLLRVGLGIPGSLWLVPMLILAVYFIGISLPAAFGLLFVQLDQTPDAV